MRPLKYFVIAVFVLISYDSFTQVNSSRSFDYNKNWYASSAVGIQISGIKDEDFISSNVAPSVMFNIGKWITPEIALQAGYKGLYFRAISDNDKHYYNFIYGDVLFNLNRIINFLNTKEGRWNLIFHPGAGYFYNKYYKRPNICANIGIMNSFKVGNQIDIFIDVSAILGWDIYQGNDDILPSCVLGISYSFK
jgi:hypothetical protein